MNYFKKLNNTHVIFYYESINENYKQGGDGIVCRWDISIVKNCRGSIYFIWVYYVAIILCLIVTIFALGLLIYKVFIKKASFWKNGMIEPIIGFLIWLGLHGIFRSVHMLIILHDWIYTWFVFKSFINTFGWIFGSFSIANYLVGIFKTVPNLAFNQRTTNRNFGNRTTRKFIPGEKSIKLVYWSFVIIFGILGIILSCLKGYFQTIGNDHYFDMIQNMMLIILGISQIIGIICFVKYGRLLVALLNETVQLLDANDYKNNPTALANLNRYKTYLTKLKLINFILTMILCWFTFLCVLLAVLRKPLGKITIFTIVLCAVTLLGSAIMMLTSLGVIFHSEIYRRYSSKVIDITTSINWAEASQIHSNISIDP